MATLLNLSRFFNYTANNCLRKVTSAIICKQYYPALRLWKTPIAEYRTVKPPWMRPILDYQTEIQEWDEERGKICTDVTNEINNQIATDSIGRMFAVVQICGKQFKITEYDIIIIEGFWPPNIGDQLKLEKVLLVGSKDFTLIGRPILNRELVSVDATVIEKTLSHTKTRFRFRPRKQYRRINFYRIQHTMLRINSININGNINEKKEVEGLDRVYY
ncbi:PREDICTED: 39S ribosomal protein L21, mitochondrial isoform X1 [Trachymyrmex septentrionalis]|uniref:39S ribosomal protein L21, mitochondrial isoform X1 n=1 Tax=Trachymyrmex septentrionalis TaxID=34720 RepID=UPI00084F7323|nr:PREDICTED: 39S ribosomal protein L21, mitochondrial isoform X1 [Trachymyrmex septentrionalis]XP_018341994.1 PREDICTED: 39S ribosomal protein L21, mitochondrial isoform X1 [Trachymyrmex septentrionalis]XP_018341995.1 PREDICTED: 39S ribosomal protein L21, mitochondrial isoform X1 [Trachymyrmex septentrionalis]